MIKNLLKRFAKSGSTKLHLMLAAAIVAAGAIAVQRAVFAEANPLAVAAAVIAIWILYSAAVAKLAAKDFGTAFQKALVLDSLTYTPMLLPLLAKIGVAAAGISFSSYNGFANLPVMMTFGAALAANVAGKLILFPKNIDTLLDNTLFNRRIKLAVAAAVVIYFIFFATVTIMRHSSFNSTAYDLGIFDQTIWGYSQGDILLNTIRGVNLLGDHMQPILLIFAPLYKFLPMPETLLALQSLALALGALPIYWIARKRIGTASAALISISYLFYPSLQYINMFDFHPEAFAVPLLLFALYFVDAKKYPAAIAMLILTGLSKEHFPLAMASVGAYVFFAQRKRKLGIVLAAAGIIWFAVNFKVLLPHFAGEAAYAHIRGYEYLGSSIWEAAKNAVLHPTLVIGNLLAADKLSYLALLFLPLGAAAAVILGLPYLLLAAPFLAINMLRSHDLTTAILYQHNAELIPFTYFAAVMGAQKLVKLLALLKLNNRKIAVGVFVLLTTITAAATYGPFATIYDVRSFVPNEYTDAGKQLLKEIPRDASVSADPLLLPHLTHRKEAYMFPNPFIVFMYGQEYWLLQNGTAEGQSKVEYVFLDLSRVSPSYSVELHGTFIAEFLNNGNYGLVKLEDSYALFRKSGSYGKGLCMLDTYFTTSTDSAVKINLNETLKEENRIYLNRCRAA